MSQILGDKQWEQGCTFNDAGQRVEAIAAWREALRLNPDHENAHLNIGLALFDSGQMEAAIAELREIVRRHADSWQAHDALGYFFWKRFAETP